VQRSVRTLVNRVKEKHVGVVEREVDACSGDTRRQQEIIRIGSTAKNSQSELGGVESTRQSENGGS
jgi:hypothetical protein